MKAYKHAVLLLIAGISLLVGGSWAAETQDTATPVSVMKAQGKGNESKEVPKPAKLAKAHKPKAKVTPDSRRWRDAMRRPP